MRLGSRGGFALLEVLIAMMTLAAIAIIFVGSVVLAEKTAHVNGQYAQAISLCQHKIDQCRAVGYGRLNHTELNDAEIVDGYPTTLPYQFDVVDDVANYLPSPSVCEVNVTPAADPDISVVTVTLTWRNAKHRTKTSTVSLSALISNVE
jgi:type II secretory pathway pseudopilin PulG